MEEREQEKSKTGLIGSQESLVAIHEAGGPPDLESMSPEEARAYLDDLFFNDLFSNG